MEDLNLSMFRAYDIRTPSASLPPHLSKRLAQAEALYFRDVLNVSGVVVAHDARLSGPAYLEQAVEEYTRVGLDVVYVPTACSASMFYFSAMQYPQYAAVMFGASHNPAGDTGRKILGPDVRPIAKQIGPEGGLDKIKEFYIQGKSAPSSPAKGRITAYDPIGDYISYSMQLAGVAEGGLSGVPILHDYLNGATGREMMLAFRRAGADLFPMHYTANGMFPLGDPNPVKPDVVRPGLEALKLGLHLPRSFDSKQGAGERQNLLQEVLTNQQIIERQSFLLGTFFDGDGDRIDFYRGDGQYMSSSFVYAAILPYIKERFPGEGLVVFADLKSNPLAVIEMAKCGVTVQVIRNGHSQIKQEMLNTPQAFGAVEESAHFYERFFFEGRGPYCTENTLYIALLVTRAWTENPERFDELLGIQAQTCRAREWGYKFPTDSQRAEALQAVEEYFKSIGASAMTKMKSGLELEATLMRRGVPFDIDADTRLADDWLQVCHRISQSENGLARWEVVGANQEIVDDAKRQIARIVRQFGAGDEYKG